MLTKYAKARRELRREGGRRSKGKREKRERELEVGVKSITKEYRERGKYKGTETRQEGI